MTSRLIIRIRCCADSPLYSRMHSVSSHRKVPLKAGAVTQTYNLPHCKERITCARMMTTTGHMDSALKEEEQYKLLREIFDEAMERSRASDDRQNPVVKFHTPQELASVVDFDVDGKPNDYSKLKKLCSAAFEYCVKTDHPLFVNQQFGGLDKYGVAAELIVSFTNANAHTFEVAPFYIMTEKAVIEKSLKLFGFSSGEGTFTPGGSYSCMMGAHLARYRKCPSAKTTGQWGQRRMVLFASGHAHYSAVKNASLMGIGIDNCVKVKCDESGKMIVSELEKEIKKVLKEGGEPFCVIGTAGTTVFGAFDSFNEIADICEKHKLWFHVDACWGGGALLSKAHRHLCDGISRADSVSWNPHKMLMMPVQCSLFLSRYKGLMNEVNSCEAPYLFQPQKPYDVEYDVGRDLIQCGRRPDSVKLWLAWKAHGDEGFEKHVDKAMENAQYLTEQVRKREHFRLVIPAPQYTNVSFWYIPPSLRDLKEDESFWEKMHLIPPKIKERMQRKGSMLIGFQPIRPLVNFFRMVVINNKLTHEDMDFVLDEIERLGADL